MELYNHSSIGLHTINLILPSVMKSYGIQFHYTLIYEKLVSKFIIRKLYFYIYVSYKYGLINAILQTV